MKDFVPFLIRAKQHTYAAGGAVVASSRPHSKDLRYAEGSYLYLDTYLGDEDFIGEEAVWQDELPIWGMNYYGWMKAGEIPDGFSECLKGALMAVPEEAPFRGPAEFRRGEFVYRCEWQGEVMRFAGREEILHRNVSIYELVFHGGAVRSFSA